SLVIGQVRTHHLDPLAARQPGGLDHHRGGAKGVERLAHRLGRVHDPQQRHRLGRAFREQRARERLVPLDLRAGTGRPDRGRALLQQRVDHAGGQRLLGAHHRNVDLARTRERGNAARIADIAYLVAASGSVGTRQQRRVLVAHERVQLTVLGHAKGKRALSSAVTDDQSAHPAAIVSGGVPARPYPGPRWSRSHLDLRALVAPGPAGVRRTMPIVVALWNLAWPPSPTSPPVPPRRAWPSVCGSCWRRSSWPTASAWR